MSIRVPKDIPFAGRGTVYNRQVRDAFTRFYKTLGCGCCEDSDGKKAAEAVLAHLLGYPAYDDGSGYDFSDPTWDESDGQESQA